MKRGYVKLSPFSLRPSCGLSLLAVRSISAWTLVYHLNMARFLALVHSIPFWSPPHREHIIRKTLSLIFPWVFLGPIFNNNKPWKFKVCKTVLMLVMHIQKNTFTNDLFKNFFCSEYSFELILSPASVYCVENDMLQWNFSYLCKIRTHKNRPSLENYLTQIGSNCLTTLTIF